MGNIQIMILHKYKCCSRENDEEVEAEEDDANKDVVKQMPIIESVASDDSFTTICINN